MTKPLTSVLLYGGGLALEYAVATLRRALPDTISITVVENDKCAKSDALYGTTMPPAAYIFNRAAGIEEPDILIKTNSALSYGTRYYNWGPNLDWVQCFNLSLPLWNGVRFHQYLGRMNEPLEPYLPGAAAGRRGRFAHPPEDKQIPLSRAEYGYQFSANEITSLLKQLTGSEGITRIEDTIADVENTDGEITSIRLTGGEELSSDLFVDVSGPDAGLIAQLSSAFEKSYDFTLLTSDVTAKPEVGPLREVQATETGWQAITPLRNKSLKTSVCALEDSKTAAKDHGASSLTTSAWSAGQRELAWVGNCVAIGSAASIIDPLTSAPFVMLMRDIERLVALIPHGLDMTVEAKEYNRRYGHDVEHALLFHMALFQTKNLPGGTYWEVLKNIATPEKLERKISQFISRGYLVNYDLEPFNEQDWTILHFGMGRRAKRHDVYIDHLDDSVIRKNLMMLRQSIESLVQKVPPHGTYMTKMQQYLERNYG